MNAIGLYTLIKKEVQRFMRVAVQTIVSPLISALLFLFVFGSVVGQRIDEIGGLEYIVFVFPGVLAMSVLTAAFMQSSSSVYFARFARHIEEMLVAPLSSYEIISGYVVGAVARGLIVGIGILIIGLFFGAVTMKSFLLFVFYLVIMSILFGLMGILIGLWSDGFEQLAILNTFVIMPLTFLGGMFNTLDMLPSAMQSIAVWNPFFYMIDGVRFAMTGFHESNLMLGAVFLVVTTAALFALVWKLFDSGWKIKV